MNNSVIETEKKKLSLTVNQLKEILNEEEISFKSLPNRYGYDPRLLASLMSMSSTKINNIKRGLPKPYFARIDFKDNKKSECENFYIGKVGVLDFDQNVLITDWRAPISTLYYDSSLGNSKYLAPDGEINGELKLKRQIIIEDGKLLDIFDVDAVSDDELLKPYLGASADSRLKNIVASIQSEQNAIIRTVINENIIVQGVAGSGKTTVALHRIAYLVYNYTKKYRPDQFMVIGPNKFFINYISSVLPDLDVGNAVQYTYEELAKNFVGENFNIQDPTNKLVELISGKLPKEYLKYKTSMKFKESIDNFFKEYEKEFFDKDGLVVNGFTVMKKEEILSKYMTINSTDMSTRLQMTSKNLSSSMKNNNEIYMKIKQYFLELEKLCKDEEAKKKLFDKRWDTNKQLETGFDKALKKYLNISNVKVLAVYKSFIENIDRFSNLDKNICEELKKTTISNISKRNVDFEDIPGLMYLKLKLNGNNEFKEFVHIVIDEAQDFGTFNFFVLKELMNKSTFSIFGDLTQGIYSYRGINNWDEVNKEVFNEECKIMKLQKSYRTTIEIMLAANLVSKHLGLGEGKPVIRHGDDVCLTKLTDENKNEYVFNLVNTYIKKSHKSIAIICKNPLETKEVHEFLIKKGMSLEIITEDNESYNGGICVVTSYLAKGLEFDAVIVYNANENCYSSKSELDMKLLYVAMTRALHNLDLLYTDEATVPIKSLEK